MILEVMNSVLLFATFVLSDIQVENCVYMSMDGSCSGSLVNGQCTGLCGPGMYDCSSYTCSRAESEFRSSYGVSFDQCYNLNNGHFDMRTSCVGDNGGNDNGGSDNGGSDNGGSDNGGSDNGGSDNGGSDNGGSDNGDDDEVAISIVSCLSQNGLCEQCQETEFDFSIFGGVITTCEQLKTHISTAYGGFEDYESCFTQSAGGISGYDTIFKCSGGASSGGSSSSGTSPSGSSSSDNTGMIVGIVIGCIVLVAGIATFVFCMKKQNKL